MKQRLFWPAGSTRKGIVPFWGRTVVFALVLLFTVPACDSRWNGTGVPGNLKVRALWVDPPGFADRKTVDNLVEKCKKAGINMIIPDVMLRENIWFKSDHFIGKVNATEEYDPLAYLIEKAHALDIEVHPWSCVYYTKPRIPEWVSKPIVPDKYDHVFLSPAHPEVNPYLVSVLKDLLNYDIDGIHLDYTRYWNAAFDYSETACQRFMESHGFNPKDFIDNPANIVPADQDAYPVRVLYPNTWLERVWDNGTVERTMNRTETGWAWVPEKVESIDRLRTPGLLVVTHYPEVTQEMTEAFQRFTERGGDLLWIYPDRELVTKFPVWATLSGLTGIGAPQSGHCVISAAAGNPAGTSFEPFESNSTWAPLVPGNAEVVCNMGDKLPVITRNKHGNGSFSALGFRVMDSQDPVMLQFFKNLLLGFREKAGVSGTDLMAEKRRQWMDWRALHILDLVRQVNQMVKEKNPKLKVTAAAGVGPQQFYGIYRDGAQWLTEGLCDFIFPMNYTENAEMLKELLDEQKQFTPEGMSNRIYPGLRIYAKSGNSAVPAQPENVLEQMELVKQEGYEGLCLFSYSFFTDEIAEALHSFLQEKDK